MLTRSIAMMHEKDGALTRRGFAAAVTAAACVAAAASVHQVQADEGSMLAELPPADPDLDDMFQIDRNINMETIDAWLDRPDVAYRDLRMFKDPAYYEAIGGSATLDFTLHGFKVVPYPYIGTLQTLPVEGAYEGPTLFDVTWSEDGDVVAAMPNYEQSLLIVEELFPKDTPLFLMCGGAGYANMMRRLLLYLGWDPALVYNVGGAWDYTGYDLVELAHPRPDGTVEFYTWRADTVLLDFDELTPMA